MTFEHFIVSKPLVMALLALGAFLANVFLLLSVQRKGSNSKAIEEIRNQQLRSKVTIMRFAFLGSIFSLAAIIIWFFLQQ